MSSRQRKIVKAILETLNSLDGVQLNEMVLHAEVSLRMTPGPGLVEFQDGLKICSDSGWVTGVQPRFGGAALYNITDAGQAVRLELKG